VQWIRIRKKENSSQKAYAGLRTEEKVTLAVDYKQNRKVITFLGSSVPSVKV
jgi:predicted GNAT family acetyltransferase